MAYFPFAQVDYLCKTKKTKTKPDFMLLYLKKNKISIEFSVLVTKYIHNKNDSSSNTKETDLCHICLCKGSFEDVTSCQGVTE